MRIFVISLIILGAFAIVRAAFPFRRESLPAGFPSFEALRAKYWKLDLGRLFGLFLGTGLLAGAFGYVLHQLATQRYAALAADALFFIEPSLNYWITTGALLALPLTVYALNRLTARRLGPDYAEYRMYYNLKYKFDGARVLPWIHRGFFAVGLVLTVLLMNWYTAFYSDRISFCPVGSFAPHTYPYAAVLKLNQPNYYGAPAGATPDQGFVIEFNDGRRWSSAESGYSDAEGNAEVLDFVAAHTGMLVEE